MVRARGYYSLMRLARLQYLFFACVSSSTVSTFLASKDINSRPYNKMMPPGMACMRRDEEELSAQEKVNQEWNAMSGEWDDLAGGYANGFYRLLWKHTGLDPSSRELDCVVDFGCGTGLLTEKLREVSSQVLAIEASSKMAEQVREKVMSREWDNVKVIAVELGNLASGEESARQAVEDMQGSADLIVASSVLTFIPEENIQATMEQIGRLLKPGGLFCHSDWPKSEAKHPDAMTEEKARSYFGMAGLETESIQIVKMPMGGGEELDVFVGVARKP